jgi:hypothetical protein
MTPPDSIRSITQRDWAKTVSASGVIFGCFQLGSDATAFDLIVTRVKERLAKIRLEDLEPKGSG